MFGVRCFLRLVCCAALLGDPAFSAESKPPSATPKAAATPPPKKKRGELEAEEEPAPIPPRESPPGAESYTVTMALIGTWQSAGRTLTIQQSGAYTLTGAENDAGFVRANLGLVWRKPNRTQKWSEGRYTFRGISAVEIEGVFGPGEWQRVSGVR